MDLNNIYWLPNTRNTFLIVKNDLQSLKVTLSILASISAHSFWPRGAITLHQCWKMASCHSPHQNRYNRFGISQVHWLNCWVADLGYYAWAVEPCSQPSTGFSVPKSWAFCTHGEHMKCTQPTMGRGLRGWVKMAHGAECCSQALSMTGTVPDASEARQTPADGCSGTQPALSMLPFIFSNVCLWSYGGNKNFPS